MKKKKKNIVTISLPEEFIEILNDISIKRDISRSQIIREILRQVLFKEKHYEEDYERFL